MIYEYALDPSLLNNWQTFRYFLEKFGTAQGRLISRYPKKWKTMVYQSITTCSEIDRKRIEEGLQRIDDRLRARYHEWDSQREWLENAEDEHVKRPFRAIISKSNPRRNQHVLLGDDISEDIPLWSVERSPVIARTAQAMADEAEALLKISSTIHFVDPYFAPHELRFRRPFEGFLERACKNRLQPPPQIVEVHLRADLHNAPAFQHFKQQCETKLPQIVPARMTVRLIRWIERADGEQFHNRFILTEKGGLLFGAGLAEGAEGQTDEIVLLDVTTVKHLLNQLSRPSPCYDFADEVLIQGEKYLT